MRNLTKTVVQLSLSAALVLVLSFSSAAKQNVGKDEGIGSVEHKLAAEQTSDRMRQGEPSEQAREQEEKALEQMDKARHRGESETEETAKGLEKQREKKMEQERKEVDKGSEQGQKMREEHSKKWWKFWE